MNRHERHHHHGKGGGTDHKPFAKLLHAIRPRLCHARQSDVTAACATRQLRRLRLHWSDIGREGGRVGVLAKIGAQTGLGRSEGRAPPLEGCSRQSTGGAALHTILSAPADPDQHEIRPAFAGSRDRFERMLGWLEGAEAGQLAHGDLEERLEADGRELLRQIVPGPPRRTGAA